MTASFTITQILSDHWDSFQLKYPNIRSVVSYEIQRVLACGDPRNGFSLYECPRCLRKRFVPFRCHSRFCSTCGAAYQDNRAASIEEKLINCRHRHVVFTIAQELRPYFRKYRALLHVLFRSAAQVIQDWALAQNKKNSFNSAWCASCILLVAISNGILISTCFLPKVPAARSLHGNSFTISPMSCCANAG